MKIGAQWWCTGLNLRHWNKYPTKKNSYNILHDYHYVLGNFNEEAQNSIDVGYRIGVKLSILLWIALKILYQWYATACRYREHPYHSHASIQCIAMMCQQVPQMFWEWSCLLWITRCYLKRQNLSSYLTLTHRSK